MSGKELDDMTFEKFKFWKVSALKDFFRKRNLSCVGTKNNACCTSVCSMEKIFQWRKLHQKEKRYLHKSLTDKYLYLEK
jgi:hypothetical protein